MGAGFTVNAHRFDPYKNFKFRINWDGKTVLILCAFISFIILPITVFFIKKKNKTKCK